MTPSPWNPIYWAILVGLTTTLLLAQQPAVRKAEPARPPSAVLSGRPDAADLGGDALGERFESRGLGLSLRPPRDMLATRRAGSGDTVEFVDAKRNWSLRISKTRTAEPTQLLTRRGADGLNQPGLLDTTLQAVAGSLGKTDVLRKDLINIGANDVGLLAIRYTKDLQTWLAQQAIVQTSDRTYYLIALTTPSGARGGNAATQPGQAAAPDAKEAAAADVFRQVIDSVQLLDLTAIRRDQDMRLFSTRALFVNFTPARLKAALLPKQWYRLVRNGKDIGYTVTIEQSAAGIPAPLTPQQRKAGKVQPDVPAGEGVLVAARTWTQLDNGTAVDSESWFFVTPDLRHEDWTTQSVSERPAAKGPAAGDHVTELGSSDRRKVPAGGDDYSLSVTHISKSATEQPVTRVLPPFYLPKAIGCLLPRIVPLTQAKEYLFYSYVSEQRELMAHYVDVIPEKRVNFNGQSIRGVQVQERLGLEGPATTHFLAPTGEYLGSENRESGILVLPTTKDALLTIWKDAKFGDPEGVSRPAPAPASPPPGAAAVPKPNARR